MAFKSLALVAAGLAAAAVGQPTLLEVVETNGSLSTLAALIDAADTAVSNVLSSPGNLTVFAPNNAAFAGLSANVLDYVTNPHNAAGALTTVLTYHVSAKGAYNSSTIPAGNLTTLDAGQNLTIAKGPFTVNGKAVITPDEAASNGYAHVIGSVLLPGNFPLPAADIPTTATNDPTLSSLVSALTTADLVTTLANLDVPFTVFAPNNAAFAKLPAGLYTGTGLSNTLLYHVSDKRTYSDQVVAKSPISTLYPGFNLTVTAEAGSVYVNGISKVITADVDANNGVVHVVDTVIATASMAAVANALANPVGTFKTLLALVAAANLTSVFTDVSKSNALTLFAPTDAVFAAAPNVASWAAAPRNAAGLAKILTYHVVATGAVWSRQLTNGQSVRTVEGKNLTITTTGGAKVNGIAVTTPDVNAYNGAIHVIGGVLVPTDAGYPTQDIPTTATGVPTLSSLVSALTTANLVTALTSPAGPFTVFAPNDAAFAKLPAGLYTGTGLSNTLLYHMSNNRTYSDTVLSKSPMATLFPGFQLRITQEGGSVYVNGISKIIQADVDTSNGVVHVVDTVIATAPLSAVAVAEGLSLLVSTATTAGLVPTLASLTTPNALTVFAPTDAAFNALGANVLSWVTNARQKTALTAVLQNHLVSGAVWSRQLTNGQTITTLGGGTLTVSINGGTVKVGAATVTKADVNGYNGAAHVIDTVLVPSGGLPGYPANDIPTTASGATDLSKLVVLLGQAGLTSALANPNGPFTVFAPSDAAFSSMPSKAVATLELLKSVLTYHVIPGRLYSTDLVNGMNLTTLQGNNLLVSIANGTVTLTSTSGVQATVTLADIDCANGAVHVVDKVLLPSAVASGAGHASVAGVALAAIVVAMFHSFSARREE